MRRPTLIIEGICGAGKTTLLKRLSESSEAISIWPQKSTYGPIVSAEDNGTLSDGFNFEILRRLTGRLEEEIRQEGGGLVLDTFHITQYVRPGVLIEASFKSIDQKLNSLGVGIVFLKMSAEDIAERTILKRKRTGFFSYIQKFGSTDEQLVEHFCRAQERMEHILKNVSDLPVTLMSEVSSLETRSQVVLDLLRPGSISRGNNPTLL